MGSILFGGLKLVDSYLESYVSIDLDETQNNLDTKPILSVAKYSYLVLSQDVLCFLAAPGHVYVPELTP